MEIILRFFSFFLFHNSPTQLSVLIYFRNGTFGNYPVICNTLREMTPSFPRSLALWPRLTSCAHPWLLPLLLALWVHSYSPLPPSSIAPSPVSPLPTVSLISCPFSTPAPSALFLLPSHSGQFSPTSGITCSFSCASVLFPFKNTLSLMTYDLLLVNVNNLSLVFVLLKHSVLFGAVYSPHPSWNSLPSSGSSSWQRCFLGVAVNPWFPQMRCDFLLPAIACVYVVSVLDY